MSLYKVRAARQPRRGIAPNASELTPPSSLRLLNVPPSPQTEPLQGTRTPWTSGGRCHGTARRISLLADCILEGTTAGREPHMQNIMGQRHPGELQEMGKPAR
ncbi:hypothetical protein NDU88_004280 [Pleurodeles waltl]|uniref:Uncharacterized protein n=1 Tax=Pleurodeles waltl TaxID=8319 RepID=A0AAV7W4U3_PLEWA|nr:hypothetical protein NDU88_004278 [Pleurodeles waltl]KAJ1208897.1 hypothetical protein NDU88_004280 [Pleurodeles waltl]